MQVRYQVFLSTFMICQSHVMGYDNLQPAKLLRLIDLKQPSVIPSVKQYEIL